MRILFSSNAPWCGTGYGVQGKSLLPRLAELPVIGGRENVGIFAWFGLQGGKMEWEGFTVYPGGAHPYGVDMIGAYAKDFGADVVITLIDIWTQAGVAEAVAPAEWWPWFPIDGVPLSKVVRDALRLDGDGKDGEGEDSLPGTNCSFQEGVCCRPLVYSRWGQEVLAEAGFESVYVPHGIEPDVFCVLAEDEVLAFREKMFPGCEHLTVMVAANKGGDLRKAFDVQVRAWAMFAADKPGARLYVHTEPSGIYGGPDLRMMCEMFGILDRVYFPDKELYWMGYPPEYLALVYNAADVYLGATRAEGFGIPLLEAQASGCPVIATDYSSMPELVHWGVCVRPRDLAYASTGTFWVWPDVDKIKAALEYHYARQDGERWVQEQRRETSEWAHSTYGWDRVVAEYWAPLFGDRVAGVDNAESVSVSV